MYRGHTVAVVMPAYNVAEHIAHAVNSIPEFVDWIIVVNDHSVDRTLDRVTACTHSHFTRSSRLIIISHEQNQGVGAAIATGYRHAETLNVELIAVMAGDGQMDPRDLAGLLDPLVEGVADYVKGNRFLHKEIWRAMPKVRLVGNIALSLITKVTSGYYRLFDSQCGYTALRVTILPALDNMFPRYGYLNDSLARLRAYDARIVEVPVRPVYQGQRSGIRWWMVFYPFLYVLLTSMIRRVTVAPHRRFNHKLSSTVR